MNGKCLVAVETALKSLRCRSMVVLQSLLLPSVWEKENSPQEKLENSWRLWCVWGVPDPVFMRHLLCTGIEETTVNQNWPQSSKSLRSCDATRSCQPPKKSVSSPRVLGTNSGKKKHPIIFNSFTPLLNFTMTLGSKAASPHFTYEETEAARDEVVKFGLPQLLSGRVEFALEPTAGLRLRGWRNHWERQGCLR